MSSQRRPDRKEEELRRRNALNPEPGKVRDVLFKAVPFFDPRDIAQVRYEMLRRHSADRLSVREASAGFGFSRPTFYQVEEAFEREGVPGLVPRKPGPKGPRRCTPEMVEFARRRREEAPDITMDRLLSDVVSRFGTRIHRRTLERGLAREAKGGRPIRKGSGGHGRRRK